jgi:hypothetical protein
MFTVGSGGGGEGEGIGAGGAPASLTTIPEVPSLSVDWITPITENPPRVAKVSSTKPTMALLPDILPLYRLKKPIMIMKKYFRVKQHTSNIKY